MKVTDLFTEKTINDIIKVLEEPECQQFLEEDKFDDLICYIKKFYGYPTTFEYIAFLGWIGVSVIDEIHTLYYGSINAHSGRALDIFLNELYGVSKATVDLTFPEGMTTFEESAAILGDTQIKTIHLPESTRIIERRAFRSVPEYAKIYIPKSAKYYKTSFTIARKSTPINKDQIIIY